MEAVVLTVGILTAVGGVAMYVKWARAGGLPAEEVLDTGIDGAVTTGLVAPHAAAALTGLSLWTAVTLADEPDGKTVLRWLAMPSWWERSPSA